MVDAGYGGGEWGSSEKREMGEGSGQGANIPLHPDDYLNTWPIRGDSLCNERCQLECTTTGTVL